MNAKNEVETDALGANGSKEVPSHVTIEVWLRKDLDRAIALLDAIRQDVELRKYMAMWFEGRLQNEKNKVDPRQTDLFGANHPK